jgi:hypothetical protein
MIPTLIPTGESPDYGSPNSSMAGSVEPYKSRSTNRTSVLYCSSAFKRNMPEHSLIELWFDLDGCRWRLEFLDTGRGPEFTLFCGHEQFPLEPKALHLLYVLMKLRSDQSGGAAEFHKTYKLCEALGVDNAEVYRRRWMFDLKWKERFGKTSRSPITNRRNQGYQFEPEVTLRSRTILSRSSEHMPRSESAKDLSAQREELSANSLEVDGELSDGESLQAFDEFFNRSSTHPSRRGAIVIQADTIQALVRSFVSGLNSQINLQPQNRLYKARTWINRWDTRAAIAIGESFSKFRYLPPAVVFSDHRSQNELAREALLISLGLGFTDQTKKTLDADGVKPWLRMRKISPLGDCVCIDSRLRPASGCKSLFLEDGDQFQTLVPCGWTKSYVKKWLRWQPGNEKAPVVWDYSIILRHTETNLRNERVRVKLLVAGFSERGTAAGGIYLGRYWPRLWRQYVRGRATDPEAGFGDFAIFIEGSSSPDDFDDWTEIQWVAIDPKGTAHRDPTRSGITREALRKASIL